jgi:manganese transport protein
LWCKGKGNVKRLFYKDDLKVNGWRKGIVIPSLPKFFNNKSSNSRERLEKNTCVVPGAYGCSRLYGPRQLGNRYCRSRKFGYTLLAVIFISNIFAMILQHLSLKLGIVAERDLAQACRDNYSKPVSVMLWFLCEIAIAACDLAEVIGSAIAMNLLFGIPLAVGVLITVLDVLVILFFQYKGFRYIEALLQD